MIENRLRAEEPQAKSARKEVELPKPIQSDRAAYARRLIDELKEGNQG